MLIKTNSSFYHKIASLTLLGTMLWSSVSCGSSNIKIPDLKKVSACETTTKIENKVNANNLELPSNKSQKKEDIINKAVINEKNEVSKEEQLLDLEVINNEFKQYGQFIIKGMTGNDYTKSMNQEWQKISVTGNPENLIIDLTKKYTYEDVEKFMINLAKYNGAELQIIGKSEQGRNIYSLSIDLKPEKKNKAILTTGQIHAREFAGGLFILKQYSELLKKAQTDEYTKLLLENIKLVSIPVINPDGREMIVNGGNENRKSNANGVDINRNFPAVNSGLLDNGTKISAGIAKKPGLDFFPGYSLGSENETKAVMKWMEVYVPSAFCYFDYHQQAHVLYGGKPWDTVASEKNTIDFAKTIANYINEGVSSHKYSYAYQSFNGLDGTGATTTDYAASIAMGMKFSPKYGRMVLINNGEEVPLIKCKDLDKNMSSYNPVNYDFRSITLEITLGRNALGYDETARKLIAAEYEKYNFDSFLINLTEYFLGNVKINEIKDYIEKQKSNESNSLKKDLLVYELNEMKKQITNTNNNIDEDNYKYAKNSLK